MRLAMRPQAGFPPRLSRSALKLGSWRPSWPERPMPQVRANGIDIDYENFGREGDPLILLIMGFAAQLIFWPESLCEGLAAKGFRVVRFDNRDIGRSTHLTDLGMPDIRALWEKAASGRQPEAPYSLSDMADDAIGLIDALGVERAHI